MDLDLNTKMKLVCLTIFSSLFQSVFSWTFEYYKESKTWEEAKVFCESQGMTAAIVSTVTRWGLVVANITSNGRYYASNDVYIGLEYNTQTNEHKWANGAPLDWSLWYTNEPYNSATRQCVRLAADVQLHFRTTDCSYSNYFLCSKDDPVTTTSSVVSESTQDESAQQEMILGLSVGFTVFVLVLAVCCLMCYCCSSSEKDKKQLAPVPRSSRQSRMKYSKNDGVNSRINSGYSTKSNDGGYDNPNFVHIEPILNKVYYKPKRDYDADSFNDSSTSSSAGRTRQHCDMSDYI